MALAAAAGLGGYKYRDTGVSEPPIGEPPTTLPPQPGTVVPPPGTPTPTPSPTTPAPPPAPATTVPPATAPVPLGPARFVRQGNPTRPEVALTFHGNGDPALAEALLAVLAKANTPVTIFAVGAWLADYPTMATRLANAGHEVANHTYTHPALGQMGAATVADEIIRCRDLLARQLPQPSPWFRPSGIEIPTATILAQAGAAGYHTVVGYGVDSLDFTDPGADAVVANTLAGLAPGAIVSLHTGHPDTIAAMPAILAGIAARRLTPVTVSTLLR